MAHPQQKRMTADEFLVWHLSQDGKYELVDGLPVPHRAMAGGSTQHNWIAANIQGHLFAQLRGSPCMPMGSDAAIRTSIEQVRFPEVLVDCTPPDPTVYEARNPIALFEVLSPTTRTYDFQIKFTEYMRHPSLRTIVLIESERMDVLVHTRDDAGHWPPVRLRQPTDRVPIEGTAASLTLAEIYERVEFAPAANGPA